MKSRVVGGSIPSVATLGENMHPVLGVILATSLLWIWVVLGIIDAIVSNRAEKRAAKKEKESFYVRLADEYLNK